jgi:hypothetical protein
LTTVATHCDVKSGTPLTPFFSVNFSPASARHAHLLLYTCPSPSTKVFFFRVPSPTFLHTSHAKEALDQPCFLFFRVSPEFPLLAAASGPVKTQSLVEFVDIMPTVMDLAGMQVPGLCPNVSRNVSLCREGNSLRCDRWQGGAGVVFYLVTFRLTN